MKKILYIILIFIGIAAAGWTQENANEAGESGLLQSYQKSFVRGSMTVKIQVLQDAAEVNQDMGPLYSQAVQFVLDNYKTLKDDSLTQQLTALAVRLIGISKYTPAANLLWDLFRTDTTTPIRVETLNALGQLDISDEKLISRLNNWLYTQNELIRGGTSVDIQVIAECLETLGKIGDTSSFPIMYATALLQVSDQITRKAKNALREIEGDYAALTEDVLVKSRISEKQDVFSLAIEGDVLSDEEKAVLAEKALEIGLTTTATDATQKEELRQLRYRAIEILTEMEWSDATDLVIDHFDQTLLEYDRGVGLKAYLLDAINCLGKMGTHEAAVRLSLYLELLNAYQEDGQKVDEQIVLSVMNNLGELADKVAFDYLIYAGYLGYSERVKTAAREAINKLK